jgi:hypothetical protein
MDDPPYTGAIEVPRANQKEHKPLPLFRHVRHQVKVRCGDYESPMEEMCL